MAIFNSYVTNYQRVTVRGSTWQWFMSVCVTFHLLMWNLSEGF